MADTINGMVKKVLLLLFLIIGFASFLFVKYVWIDSQNAYGRLKIDVTPVASVFMNNVAVGRVPYEDKYKIGEHILKLIPEDVATSTASWQRKITIYKNALTYVNAQLGVSDIATTAKVLSMLPSERKQKTNRMGEVYIETEPGGAIVYFDNDEKGISPMLLSDIVEGDHEISIFMPGFFRSTENVKITPKYKISAFFKLAIDEKQQKALKGEDRKIASQEAVPTPSLIQIQIKDTPTGWLRVRFEPSLNASEAARIKPGDKFTLLEENDDWYKIKYDATHEGWISSVYAEKTR